MGIGPVIFVLALAAVAVVATVLRWQAIRRPAAMTILVLAVAAAGTSMSSVGVFFIPVLVVIDLVLVGSLRRTSAERRASAAALQASAAEREHAARVAYVRQWQQAWSDANGGAAPPEGLVPPVGLAAPATGTNTMAILAIIFGFGGGLLGIVFGHIALSQIRRTGEKGRGLALTGLIFGYLGLATLIVIIIVFATAASHF